VPDRPATAQGLGFDVPTWIKRGLIDRLVVTPFLFSDFDMPIENWKQLLAGSGITLDAGLMVSIRPYQGAPVSSHTLATARGAAMGLLDRGADGVYLFNFFDDVPYGVTGEDYRKSASGRALQELVQQIGSVATMEGRPRRHIVTNPDTWAPQESPPACLPRDFSSGKAASFSIPTGPIPCEGQVVEARLSVRSPRGVEVSQWEVRVNGQYCRFVGPMVSSAKTASAKLAFEAPLPAIHRGMNELLVSNSSPTPAQLDGVELAFSGPRGMWPDSKTEAAEFDPQ
jgi:hypothetical protein